MMEDEKILELKNVIKKIQNKKIIDNVSFSVYSGEIFGFLGPNGAGKTTIIRMITGLIKVSQGEIYIDSYSIRTEFTRAIKHVGGIIENPDLYKYLTGYENLKQYARMVSGITKDRIIEVIELLGLSDNMNEKVKNYSLGMRQRLGLAQAILHQPSLLILDEPTNGLDPEGIHELRDYLKEIAHKEGVAVLVSSHLLSEMQLMCDRIGVLKKGRMVAIQDLHSFVNSSLLSQIKISIDEAQLDKTLQILNSLSISVVSVGKNTELTLDTDKNNIPIIIKKLSNLNISIYSVYLVEHTLEEQFLHVTEEEE